MEQQLQKERDCEFYLTDTFRGELLAPVIKNLLWKAEHGWDDYDEVAHCCRLVEQVKQDPNMQMDFHYIKKGGAQVGLATITHGKIDKQLFFPASIGLLEDLDKIVMFNYFHVSSEGRGNGAHWMRDIIMPYYGERGFQALYVKSSHPKVFSLYGRLGDAVGTYLSKSDNGLFEREGRMFRVPLTK